MNQCMLFILLLLISSSNCNGCGWQRERKCGCDQDRERDCGCENKCCSRPEPRVAEVTSVQNCCQERPFNRFQDSERERARDCGCND